MGKLVFEAFWGELSPCAHVVQIYENDAEFVGHLAEFAAGGLVQGESVVIIATPMHRLAVVRNLFSKSFDLGAVAKDGQLIMLDAEETVAKFLVNGAPDEKLFQHVVGEVLERATRNGRKVRAFGEMVALLWAKGLCGATIRLEHLWTDLCRKQAFSLFCAYPKAGFTENPSDDIARICDVHSAIFKPAA